MVTKNLSEQVIDCALKEIEENQIFDDALDFDSVEKKSYMYEFHRKMFYERVFAMDIANQLDWNYDIKKTNRRVFFKRVIRKINNIMLAPAFKKQNNFNGQTVASLQEVAGYINQCEKRIEMLESEIEKLKGNIK